MSNKELTGAGLRGQVAGDTALCTVGKTGSGLTYRGFDINDLANLATFEEVAYLLLQGRLPNQTELDNYLDEICSLRTLPKELRDVLERLPASAHPMDVMRTGCSTLGNLEMETGFEDQDNAANRLLAIMPSIICYWYNFSHKGTRTETESEHRTIGEHFLHMLSGDTPSKLFSEAMNTSLILYAEHEFNASTFAARVCASTLSDMHSCVCAAIGTLRGPLHGGANEAAMEMIENWKTTAQAEEKILDMLERKEKIMGFGHAIYRTSDPRNAIIKKWSKKLGEEVGDESLFAISERCEQVMLREKGLFCNADFFHASAYRFINIPTKLFTPIFVMSRVTGWTAHVKEQRDNNRIIRPSANYLGPENNTWIPIENR